MKTMLIASSALALVAAPSFAQDPAYDPATQQPATGEQRTDHRADDGLFDDWFDDGHSLEGTPVYTNDGERVGSVERVRGGAGSGAYADLTDGTTRDLDVTGLVVETGGFLGIGTREVDVDAGNAQRTSVDGEQRIILDMSNAEFERLREHARDRDRAWDADRRDERARDAGQWTDDRGGLIPASNTQTGVQGQVGHDRGTFATDDAFRDDHPLRDVAVYTNDGERVGSVERVRGGSATDRFDDLVDGSTEDLNVSGLVVETGGFLGIGTREVEIEAGNAQRTSVDGDQRIILDMSNAEFERLREHARDRDDGMWGTDDRTDRTWQDRQDGAAIQTDAGVQGQAGAGAPGQTQAQTQAGVTGDAQLGQTTQRAGMTGEARSGVYTDQHDWVDAPVFSSDGERVGRVRQVRTASGTTAMTGADSDVAAIVVRTGGFLGLGSREVEIDANQVRQETQQGDPRLVLDMTEDRFGELPDHDRNRARAGG